jgi:acyl-CoA thioesterase-1
MIKYLFALFLVPISLMAAVKVTIIGDSISTGYGVPAGTSYVDLLRNRYTSEGKDVALINRSYAGGLTDTAMLMGLNTITEDRPDYIILFLGINDAGFNVPQTNLMANFSSMMSRCKPNCKRIILGGVNSQTVNPSYNTVLATVYQALINAYNPYPVMLLGPEVLATAPDGIHPNQAGHQMIANYVYNALQAVGAY